MDEFYSFNREKDSDQISKQLFKWYGPYSWPGQEKENNLSSFDNLEGVYLVTFECENKDGYLLYWAGHGKDVWDRFSKHTTKFKKGNYSILDVECASRGIRKEIWPGWGYAKKYEETHTADEYQLKMDALAEDRKKHLSALKIFVAEVPKQYRERMEAALMHGLHYSKNIQSELAEGNMNLRGRKNSQVPIIAVNTIVMNNITNNCKPQIQGLFEYQEI